MSLTASTVPARPPNVTTATVDVNSAEYLARRKMNEPPSPGASREVFARHVDRSLLNVIVRHPVGTVLANRSEEAAPKQEDDDDAAAAAGALSPQQHKKSLNMSSSSSSEGGSSREAGDYSEMNRTAAAGAAGVARTADSTDSPRRRFLFPKMGTLFSRSKPSPRHLSSTSSLRATTSQRSTAGGASVSNSSSPHIASRASEPNVGGGGVGSSQGMGLRNSASPRMGTKKRLGGGGSQRQKSALMGPRDPAGGDNRICLILDLDETLVRSSFDSSFDADFIAPFTLNGSWCTARVRKRPHVDDFLRRVARHYEVIVMTAGVEPYASLVLDTLDKDRTIERRFYRDSCTKTVDGLLVKDLSRLSRDLARTIVVDNSPNAYLWHPKNAIDVTDFVGDASDCELPDIAAFLENIKDCPDVRPHLPHWRHGGRYKPKLDGSMPSATNNNGKDDNEAWAMGDLRI